MKCLHRENGRPRRCKRQGCTTWLSSYNPDDVCVCHGGWRPVRDDNNKRTAQERGDLLAEVLEAI